MRVVVIGILAGLALAIPAWAQAQTATDAASSQVQHGPAPPVAPPQSQPPGALTPAETRALLDAARETAKATREAVDYARVVPDILQQILTKLDKIEDKLDKVENAVKAQNRRR